MGEKRRGGRRSGGGNEDRRVRGRVNETYRRCTPSGRVTLCASAVPKSIDAGFHHGFATAIHQPAIRTVPTDMETSLISCSRKTCWRTISGLGREVLDGVIAVLALVKHSVVAVARHASRQRRRNPRTNHFAAVQRV
eukprot:2570986-Rhodomonas_salina.3